MCQVATQQDLPSGLVHDHPPLGCERTADLGNISGAVRWLPQRDEWDEGSWTLRRQFGLLDGLPVGRHQHNPGLPESPDLRDRPGTTRVTMGSPTVLQLGLGGQ